MTRAGGVFNQLMHEFEDARRQKPQGQSDRGRGCRHRKTPKRDRPETVTPDSTAQPEYAEGKCETSREVAFRSASALRGR